jgi:hypothetical protein
LLVLGASVHDAPFFLGVRPFEFNHLSVPVDE